jgi:ribosomal protein L1
MKKGKKYTAAFEKVDATKLYTIEEAAKFVCNLDNGVTGAYWSVDDETEP